MNNSITPKSEHANRCHAWCIRHDPDGNICHADDLETIGLTYQPAEGLKIHIDDECISVAEASERARAIFAQIQKTTPKPEYDIASLPPAWESAAETKGRDRAMAVRFEYLAEMAARDHEHENPEPACWLATDPCPAWCQLTETHRTSDHPDDRAHDGPLVAVQLRTMEAVAVQFADSTRFAPPELHLMLTKSHLEGEPRVSINDSGDQVRMHATLDELERIGNAMLDMVRQGRGQQRGTTIPFQHGPIGCDDVTCKCHEQLRSAER